MPSTSVGAKNARFVEMIAIQLGLAAQSELDDILQAIDIGGETVPAAAQGKTCPDDLEDPCALQPSSRV